MTSEVAAFYINIDRRTDRRKHIEAQLKRIGMTAERVPATTPADIAPEQLAAAKIQPTELACSISHQRIWQMILDRGLPDALIIEDDALLSTTLPRVLGSATLRNRVDAIQFESHPSNALVGPPVDVGGVSVRRLMSSSLGTCAYYITAGLAARLLERGNLDRAAVDKILFGRDGDTIYQDRVFQSVPALAIQLGLYNPSDSVGHSDLVVDRLAIKSGRRPRTLGRRLSRLASNTSYAMRIIGAFAPTGELFGARQLDLPIADDLRIQLDATSRSASAS